MKWYFACSKGSDDFYPLLKAAVNSALENTTLKPNFIYDGEPDELTEWLKNKGVNIIYHKVSFADRILETFSEKDRYIPLGAYLRCDIPVLEKDEEYILYTDCDVIFLKDINEYNTPKPKYFACSSQFNKKDFIDFNTGVMVMNVATLKESHSQFVEFIKENINRLPVFDQSAYQFFYGKKNEKLDVMFNHKPYWGVEKNAYVVHFHGPKPLIFTTDDAVKNLNKSFTTIYKKNPESYDYYLNLFKRYYEIDYDYTAIELLKKGIYPLNKTNNRPLNIRIKNFFAKRISRFKSIFRNIS